MDSAACKRRSMPAKFGRAVIARRLARAAPAACRLLGPCRPVLNARRLAGGRAAFLRPVRHVARPARTRRRSPRPADPWLGRVVDGRYRVLARLGHGGMGVVYRVEHLHLGKTAAMKVLAPDTAAKPEMVRRFRLEAQSVSKLNHPEHRADVRLRAVGRRALSGDGVHQGRRSRRRCSGARGRGRFARAARFFVQVCSGLTEAHEAGIVHRDLKPENLMVVHRREGVEHAKVLDFGLAKLRERGDAERAISSGGQVIGTPYYMAPEQVRGEDARRARRHLQPGRDAVPRADGRAAVRRAVADERAVEAPHRRRRAAAQPRAWPSLPPEADRIVLRAMAKARRGSLRVGRGGAAGSRARAASPSGARRRDGALRRRRVRARQVAPLAGARRANAASRRRRRATLADTDSRTSIRRRRSATGLRRSDVDDYEWSLRRQRLLRRLVLPRSALPSRAPSLALIVWRAVTPRADIGRARAEQHARVREPARLRRAGARHDRRAAQRSRGRRRLLPRARRARARARCTRGWKGSRASTWCWSCSTRRGGASPRATRAGAASANGCSRRRSARRRRTSPCARSGSKGRSRRRTRWIRTR